MLNFIHQKNIENIKKTLQDALIVINSEWEAIFLSANIALPKKPDNRFVFVDTEIKKFLASIGVYNSTNDKIGISENAVKKNAVLDIWLHEQNHANSTQKIILDKKSEKSRGDWSGVNNNEVYSMAIDEAMTEWISQIFFDYISKEHHDIIEGTKERSLDAYPFYVEILKGIMKDFSPEHKGELISLYFNTESKEFFQILFQKFSDEQRDIFITYMNINYWRLEIKEACFSQLIVLELPLFYILTKQISESDLTNTTGAVLLILSLFLHTVSKIKLRNNFYKIKSILSHEWILKFVKGINKVVFGKLEKREILEIITFLEKDVGITINREKALERR